MAGLNFMCSTCSRIFDIADPSSVARHNQWCSSLLLPQQSRADPCQPPPAKMQKVSDHFAIHRPASRLSSSQVTANQYSNYREPPPRVQARVSSRSPSPELNASRSSLSQRQSLPQQQHQPQMVSPAPRPPRSTRPPVLHIADSFPVVTSTGQFLTIHVNGTIGTDRGQKLDSLRISLDHECHSWTGLIHHVNDPATTAAAVVAARRDSRNADRIATAPETLQIPERAVSQQHVPAAAATAATVPERPASPESIVIIDDDTEQVVSSPPPPRPMSPVDLSAFVADVAGQRELAKKVGQSVIQQTLEGELLMFMQQAQYASKECSTTPAQSSRRAAQPHAATRPNPLPRSQHRDAVAAPVQPSQHSTTVPTVHASTALAPSTTRSRSAALPPTQLSPVAVHANPTPRPTQPPPPPVRAEPPKTDESKPFTSREFSLLNALLQISVNEPIEMVWDNGRAPFVSPGPDSQNPFLTTTLWRVEVLVIPLIRDPSTGKLPRRFVHAQARWFWSGHTIELHDCIFNQKHSSLLRFAAFFLEKYYLTDPTTRAISLLPEPERSRQWRAAVGLDEDIMFPFLKVEDFWANNVVDFDPHGILKTLRLVANSQHGRLKVKNQTFSIADFVARIEATTSQQKQQWMQQQQHHPATQQPPLPAPPHALPPQLPVPAPAQAPPAGPVPAPSPAPVPVSVLDQNRTRQISLPQAPSIQIGRHMAHAGSAHFRPPAALVQQVKQAFNLQ